MKLHWGTGIAAVYALFAAATVGFAAFALDQDVELVSADYYQRALRHDQRMAALANAADLGTDFRLDADPDGREVGLVWSAARPDEGAGTVTLYRASDARLDRTIPVKPDLAGRQRISLGDLPHGRWLVQVHWRAGEREYYVERRLDLVRTRERE